MITKIQTLLAFLICFCTLPLFAYSFDNTTLTINTIDVTMVTCNGLGDGSVGLSVSGGDGNYTYSWSNGMTTDAISGLAPNTYLVTVTDGTNCTGVEQVIITEPPVLVTGLESLQKATCNGSADGMAKLSVAGGNGDYTYLWPDGNMTIEATNLSAGTYNVTVTDKIGCTAVQEVIITENPSLETGFLDYTNVTCNGGSDGTAIASANAGSGGYTYAWSDGTMGINASGLSAGLYYLTVTDSEGCTGVDSLMITEEMPIVITLNGVQGESSTGSGDGWISVDVWGGNSPYTYEWRVNGTTVSTAQDAGGLTSGNYTLIVTDSTGCNMISEVITLGISTSTYDLKLEQFIQLSPNPSDGDVRLELELPQSEKVSFEVMNTVGQVIYQKTSTVQKEIFNINMNEQSSGLYFVRIKIADRMITKKLMIQ